jgi:hypothetical protein
MDFALVTPDSPFKTCNIPRGAILRASFRVGHKYKCTMTLDCSAISSGASGYFRAEWEPALPDRRLSKVEMRDYRAGRDAFLVMAANAIGGSVAIAEV